MVIFYVLISVFIQSIISLIGVVTLAINNEKLRKMLFIFVSFSTGTLLGDVFIHILPEISQKYTFSAKAAIYILTGFILFFILEKFIHWQHCHVPTTVEHPHPFGVINLVGDGLHNFIDGAVIAGSYMLSFPLGLATSLAVIFHEIPQEIGDYSILIHAGFTKNRALFYNFLSSLLAFLGAILILIFGRPSDNFFLLILSFTAGGFLYLAGSDLIPELHKETAIWRSVMQLIGIILGILIMIGLLFID